MDCLAFGGGGLIFSIAFLFIILRLLTLVKRGVDIFKKLGSDRW
jgi:hypothetical protein